MNERTSRKIAAVIVAAGRGLRAGGDVPKQFRRIGAYTVAEWSLRAFAQHPEVDELVLVHPEDGSVPVNLETTSKNFRFCLETEPAKNTDKTQGFTQATPPRNAPNSKIFRMVMGGATRDASVKLGLQAVSRDCDVILIHDAARPCIPSHVISAVIEALATNPAAAPALPVIDALWTGEDAKVTGVQSRDALFRAQTPQGFHAAAIRAAHAAHPGGAADDVEVARAAGLDVQIVPGDERNLKITAPEDFARASAILEPMMDIRTGNGFDVHRFGPGDHVMLCGVKIPHERGLQGHSDADVGLHTITDAIYGALAAGDIGQHFPPSDPQWKGAASDLFLSHAREMADDKGFAITHVDCTLICEFPKIGPHAAAMRSNLSELLHISDERISVKATTSERLGFTGRGEGIACMATATLVKS